MKSPRDRTKGFVSICASIILLITAADSALANPNPTVDCNCLANLPALHTACPGIVPDLGLLGTNCFSTNVNINMLGYYNQLPPAGTWVGAGTNQIQLTIFDTNYNYSQCTVDFIVTPGPSTNLTLVCVSNKTVQCGSAWQFDTPTAFTTCCTPGLTVTNLSTVTNFDCPKYITNTWKAMDMCGNVAFCSQLVVVEDTTPPLALCSGANLVPNPGFESIAYCPSNVYQLGPLFPAYPWFSPTASSPDDFNACDPTGTNVCVPVNAFGFQNAFSGQGYGGAYVYGPTSPNTPNNPYREYLETPLLMPLLAGQVYRVSFYVNLADVSGRAIAQIGAYFSANPATDPGNGIIPVVPQVVNPAGNLLTSTNSWMLVQGTFTAAGGESFLTIGNFLADANTASTNMPSLPQYANFGYYYYDEVSVTAVCPPQATNKVVQCGMPVIFDPPVGFDLCSGTNVTVMESGTTLTGTCPKTLTRHWTLTDNCANTNTWIQTITVIDTNPPIVLCASNNLNLVPNPQFELYTNCPTYTSQFDTASPWFTPTMGSSDYFNTCALPQSYVSVPVNFLGVQSPLSGQGYAGAILYTGDGGNLANSYREYIEVPLTSPLSPGQQYLVSFHVSLADFSQFAIAEIGAHFSVGPVVNYASQVGLPLVPQVMNSPWNLLSDTNSWMLVQGIFTANGGEDHMTIGNFLSDAATTAVSSSGTQTWAYYYFDDVSVAPLCQLATNKTVACGSPWTFDTPVPYDLCSGTNVTINVLSTTTNACGSVFTRTWLFTDSCSNSTTWNQTVTISDPSPVTINCFCLSELASTVLYTNGCVGIVPNLLQFSNCFSANCRPLIRTQTPPPGTVEGPGTHPITVSVTDCSGTTNSCALSFTVAGAPPTITCPKDITLFTCGSGAVAWFTPTATGNTSPIICSPPSGSFFPVNQSTLVTCTTSNACGSASCQFGVTVMTPRSRWPCNIIIVIGIPITPLGTAIATCLPPFGNGGQGVDFNNLGTSGQDGIELNLGPAQKLTFSTVLDFNAPSGATVTLALPANTSTGTGPEPLVTFTRTCHPACGWTVTLPNGQIGSTYRSIAIGTNGDLFSSFTLDASTLANKSLVNLVSATGVSNAVMTATFDCVTREITLGFPECAWTPDPARKGWDGLVYGNAPRGSKTNQTARVILTPLTTIPYPPITNVDLLAANVSTLAFDDPAITTMGRKWGGGHVTLMKAYDDGGPGLEFASFGSDGGVTTDLGNAATFSLRTLQLDIGGTSSPDQLFTIRGWPPGTTTNRPPPPPIYARLTSSSSGTSVDCAADYTSFGISNVTVQLWNGTTLVSENVHVTAGLNTSLASLSVFPTIVSSPGAGVLSISHTNPFVVLSGLNCPTTGCLGSELRIIPESSSMTPPPVAFGELTCTIANGMDDLIYAFQTTPACVPIPLNVLRDSAGNVTLSWDAPGFHLLGAENVNGPWYDLGVTSPVTLTASHTARYFRLACD